MTSIHGSLTGFLQVGLLASGSSYLLRLPIPVGTVACAAFVPGYSGGSATDSHRLPWFTRAEPPVISRYAVWWDDCQ